MGTNNQHLEEFVEGAMLEYGSHVVENRAIPDYRDGLKPVHRAILWSMYQLGLHYNDPYKKAARTVGDVIGKYHPHGDQACYDAMVTIANSLPNLVDGFGNWGRHDSSAAAMRYCFTGDTLVSTEKGLIPIGDIPSVLGLSPKKKLPIQLKVETRNGVEEAAFWLDSGVREIYRVETAIGHIKGTSNEPLLVLSSDLAFVWRTIETLEEGDVVCYKRNPSVSWPKQGSVLIQPEAPSESSLRYGYKVYPVPKRMSADFAAWLGLLISEGSIGTASIQFMNSDEAMVNLFTDLTEKLFPGIVVSTTWREPDKKNWAKRKYAQVTINSTHVRKFLEANGIHPCTAKDKEIPACVLRGSKKEVVAFLSALFEGDGSVHNSGISYSSRSNKLLDQLQVLLLTKFGLPFRQSKHTLYLCSKTMYDKFQREIGFLSERKGGRALNSAYDNQKLSWLPQVVRDHYSEILDSEVNEHNQAIPRYELAMLRGLSGRAMPCTLESLREWLSSVGKFVGKHFPSLVGKLRHILDCDYFLTEVRSIRYIGDEATYDLTVPGSNSYTANGMIVHNTEARLSEFSDKFILDPKYLAVVPYVKNFSNDAEWPLFFPAKLPVILLTGTVRAPAFGVAVGMPSFKLKGVLKAVKRCLQGEKITSKWLAKNLEVNSKYGGRIVSTFDEILEVYKTGRGSIRFVCETRFDRHRRELYIESCSPAFGSQNTIEKKLVKLRDLPGIKEINDDSAAGVGNYNIRYTISFKKNLDDHLLEPLISKIEKELTGALQFNIGYTRRNKDGSADFGEVNVAGMLEKWCEFRVKLESAVLKKLIADEEKKYQHQEMLQFAVDHLEDIFQALKSKKDPDQMLMKKWKKPAEFVKAILDLQARRLAKLELNDILAKQKEIKKTIKSLKADQKAPADRVLRQLDEVDAYIKKTKDKL